MVEDDLYGTVVTIDHGDGTKAVYANLASEPAVAVNDAVEPAISSALSGPARLQRSDSSRTCTSPSRRTGKHVNPLEFLPG